MCASYYPFSANRRQDGKGLNHSPAPQYTHLPLAFTEGIVDKKKGLIDLDIR
jgi:hypothetical protein